jgi:hypothetical protein
MKKAGVDLTYSNKWGSQTTSWPGAFVAFTDLSELLMTPMKPIAVPPAAIIIIIMPKMLLITAMVTGFH